MKNMHRISAVLIGAASIAAMGAALADARTDAYHDSGDFHVGFNAYGDSRISMDGDDVVIKGRDGSKARVTPTGDLYIDAKQVVVTDTERKLLVRYHLGIRNIQERGLQIGRDAIHLASGVISTVVADLFSGDGDDDGRIDHDAEAQAEPLKREAQALCRDVQSERQLQSDLVTQLPAFQPYAVIHTVSDHDCHVDHDDVEV